MGKGQKSKLEGKKPLQEFQLETLMRQFSHIPGEEVRARFLACNMDPERTTNELLAQANLDASNISGASTSGISESTSKPQSNEQPTTAAVLLLIFFLTANSFVNHSDEQPGSEVPRETDDENYGLLISEKDFNVSGASTSETSESTSNPQSNEQPITAAVQLLIFFLAARSFVNDGDEQPASEVPRETADDENSGLLISEQDYNVSGASTSRISESTSNPQSNEQPLTAAVHGSLAASGSVNDVDEQPASEVHRVTADDENSVVLISEQDFDDYIHGQGILEDQHNT